MSSKRCSGLYYMVNIYEIVRERYKSISYHSSSPSTRRSVSILKLKERVEGLKERFL